MSMFEKRFLSILEADDSEAAAPQPEVSDAQAMQSQLDTGTDPKALDAQTPPPGVDQAIGAHNAAQKKVLSGWIDRIAEFVGFLNGVDGNSVQSQLAASSCDTMFEKISTSEKKRIARVAMELSSFIESLKGYLISNDDR